ncbi:MAG: cytochrome c oxidase subunit 3 [Rhodoferax sp.]
MSQAAVLPAAAAQPAAPRLAGDLAVWLIIGAEMLAFAILFLSYAVARSLDVAAFNASQAQLALHTGAINTVLLITGSWCVARAVAAARQDKRQRCVQWLLAALACGAGFVLLKSLEFADKFAAGLDLSTNTFFMFYFLLTGFHFLHVLVAMVFLGFLLVLAWRGAYGAHDTHALESGAAFWHMVDLLWIVLFPLVYVMR